MIEAEIIPPRTISERVKLIQRVIVAYSARQSVRCLALVLIGAGVRFPALQGPLLWDDLYLVRDNPFIKSPLLIPEAFRHYLFPDSFAGHYRPIQTISYVFDYLIWNTNPYGYHLSSLFWHIGSGLLLYFLLRRLLESMAPPCFDEKVAAAADQRTFDSSNPAFLIALLWIVHPVHSAAVDYISGRADSLSFFFSCSGWLLYLRAREIARPVVRCGCYTFAVFLALLALCSRETGCVWMIVFLLNLFIFDRKPTRRAKLTVLSCCLALAGAYGTLRALPEYHESPETSLTPTASGKAVLMLRALGDYGRLMTWPANLHMERSLEDGNSLRGTSDGRRSISIDYLSIVGLLVAAAFLIGASRKGLAQPTRLFGAGWFVVTYLPISNLFNLNATVAEHWLYVPSVGCLVFAVGCCLDLPRRETKIVWAILCVAILGLSVRSFVRSSDWASAETFYRRTLLAGGISVRMCVNLAAIYSKRGENAKAESLLRKVLRADPSYLVARNNLASILSGRGEKAEAEHLFDLASKPTPEERANYPRTWTASLNLAGMAHGRQDDQSALAIIDQARREYPWAWELVRYEAELLRTTCGPDTALPIVQEFARNHWWHCGAFTALGRLSWEKGDLVGAEKALRHASWLDVHDAEALSVLVVLKLQENQLEDAFQTQRRVVSRQPDEPRSYLLLSTVLEKMGRTVEAQAAIDRVSYLRTLARSQPIAD